MAKQNFVGMVISHGKMNKTVKVRVQRMHYNKLVKKDVIRYTDFLVHDEANKCKEGDVVRIQYVRPLSARKSFAVSEILKNKGLSWIQYKEEAPAKVAAEEMQKVEEYKEQRAARRGENGEETVAQQMDNLRRLNKLSVYSNPSEADEKFIKATLSKLGVSSWPNDGPILTLDVAAIRAELESLNIEITNKNFSAYARDMLENEPKKADNLLRSMGKAEPEKMAKNIKKNLIMKHFVKTLGKTEAPAPA